ncbi:sulfotransferase [Paraglaciecola chathamensis]|uniref:sulfotransferase n=1 Tax=Paraglaciecola chathamensis TaxID=368405 RepID=UPI0026FD47F1|nr:sulfotransferase [Paraglaciecola chathamensis]MDO6841540.1 sulfotransferase [Paraglaciecola chathamensis]
MENRELDEIIKLFHASKFDMAKEACLNLLKLPIVEKEPLYIILLEVAKINRDDGLAIQYLDALIELRNDNMEYYCEKAELCRKSGKINEGIQCYEQFIARNPEHANARYNFALYLKKNGQTKRALECYSDALALNIDNPSEVYLNQGVIYTAINDTNSAIECYLKALTLNKHYTPALYNLGGVYEELGERAYAIEQYSKIIVQEPENIRALSRLIQLREKPPFITIEVQRLESILKMSRRKALTSIDIETGYFALGYAYDCAEEYSKAFHYYKKGNELSANRSELYQPDGVTNETQKLISHFTRSWLGNNQLQSDYSPIFVCGMFRSGSTLVESILSEHPAVYSGGELNFLDQVIRRTGDDITRFSVRELQEISKEYRQLVVDTFGENCLVIDKRPDNFKYIGLIKAVFPNAKIICTDRDPLDICISIYFQQLDSSLNYSTELRHIAHYYLEYKKILQHWMNILPDDIYVADYERLVDNPKEVCSELFAHFNLEWCEEYLNFYKTKKLVKTASIWQVRRPLQRGVARSEKYKSNISEIKELLNGNHNLKEG